MIQDFAIYLVAVGLMTLSIGQFFVAGLSFRRMRRRQSIIRKLQLARLRSATKVARLNSQLSTQTTDQTRQWRVMEVLKVVNESRDTKSYYLSDPNQQALPTFFPGQYLMLRPALAGQYQTTRCYSISVAPNTRLWRVTVKRQHSDKPLRPDRKSGGLSTWLHENIRDGDCLLVGGPSGHFYLAKENTNPLVLLAAGVGITPMASIVQYSTHFTPQRPVSLYYQAKDQQHWPLGDEVHSYVKSANRCRVVSYLTRASSVELQHLAETHPGVFREGRIVAQEVVEEVALPGAHFFMCGPEEWMSDMRQQLIESGVPLEQIHWESFGGMPTTTADTTSTQQSYSVQFAKSETTAACQSNDQSLWELAQANDVHIPSGCLSGVCGSCRVKLLKGQVSYDRAIGVGLAENECLTCVAKPASDLVLDI